MKLSVYLERGTNSLRNYASRILSVVFSHFIHYSTWTPLTYAYNFLCIHFYALIKPSVTEVHQSKSLFNVLSHFNDDSCSLIDYCRFVYNVKFNILVWFDWLQFRAWNLEWSQMWACWEGTTQSTPCTQKVARGKMRAYREEQREEKGSCG